MYRAKSKKNTWFKGGQSSEQFISAPSYRISEVALCGDIVGMQRRGCGFILFQAKPMYVLATTAMIDFFQSIFPSLFIYSIIFAYYRMNSIHYKVVFLTLVV